MKEGERLGHAVRMGGTRNALEMLVFKPESNIPLTRFMLRANVEIKVEVGVNGYYDVN
jgi:hypothetical protein